MDMFDMEVWIWIWTGCRMWTGCGGGDVDGGRMVGMGRMRMDGRTGQDRTGFITAVIIIIIIASHVYISAAFFCSQQLFSVQTPLVCWRRPGQH